jgi:hypothetical protein
MLPEMQCLGSAVSMRQTRDCRRYLAGLAFKQRALGHQARGDSAICPSDTSPLVLPLRNMHLGLHWFCCWRRHCFADLLWPIFLLVGLEKVRIDPGNTKFTPLDLYHNPWSHSLLMDSVWASVFALVYYAIARYRPGAVAIWIGVVSHWILDWITHRPRRSPRPTCPRPPLSPLIPST